MKMKVYDQLHISSVSDKTMGKDTEFEVSDDEAKRLMEAGHAYPRGMSRDDYARGLAERSKAMPVTKNKQMQITQNKIIGGKAEGKNQPAPTTKKTGKASEAKPGESAE